MTPLAYQRSVALGANPAQVVNAHRGMTTAADGGKATREGVTRRGLAGTRLTGQARQMPEQIIADAISRDDAVRQLHQHGYIL